jgi:hypothetical protein
MKRTAGFALVAMLLLGCKGMEQFTQALMKGLENYLNQQSDLNPQEQKFLQDTEERQTAAVAGVYNEQQQAGDVDIDIGYPFLIEENLLTSAVHLCGSNLAGKQFDLVKFHITNRTQRRVAGLRVEVGLQEFSDPAVRTVALDAGRSVEIGLTPNFRNIGQVTEMRPTSIHMKITQDGRPIYENTKRVTLLSRNDVLLSQNYFTFCTTMVTPNDRMVDQLVSHAANYAPNRTIAGYQRDSKNVWMEVKAVYETIAALGVHYRSNTTSFLNEGNQIKAQRVTFPAESISGTGANCIDGTLLFASAFENMGLLSYICLVPGHAFVGVKLEKNTTKVLFIETTMVGTNAFEQAIEVGGKKYMESAKASKAQLIDLSHCRSLGIKPFPYPLGSMTFPSDRLAKGDRKPPQPPPGPTPPAPGPDPGATTKLYACPQCRTEFQGRPGTQVDCPGCGILLNLPGDQAGPDRRPPPEPPAPEKLTEEEARTLFQEAMDHHTAGRYNESIPAFQRIYLDLPTTDLGISAAYNVACAYSLTRNSKEALQWLEVAFQRGFLQRGDQCHRNGLEHAEADADLDNIRRTRQYRDMIRRYGSMRY